MKRFLGILTAFCVLLTAFGFTNLAMGEESSTAPSEQILQSQSEQVLEKLDSRRIKKYKLPQENIFILKQEKADVNGDGKEETVYFLGQKFEDSDIYMEHVYILIENLKGRGYLIKLPEDGDGGYTPDAVLADITGDSIPEIVISLPTGGSGGIINYYIYTAKDERPRLIFNSQRDIVNVSGNFDENYKAKICIKDPNGTYDIQTLLDLKDRKEIYDELGLYSDGKLQKPGTEIMPYPYGLINVKDLDNDGVYELEAYQSVRGIAGADSIAEIITHWKWVDNAWVVTRIGIEKE